MVARRIILTGCLLGLVVLSITSTTAADEDNLEEFKMPDIPYDQKTSQLVAQSVMNFAHNLAVALDTDEYPNTQIFSPLSVMSALSILQMGSYGNSYNQLNQLFALLNGENATSSSRIHEEFGWLLEDVMMLNSKNPKRSRSLTEWRSKPFHNHGYRHASRNNLADHTIRVSNGLFIQHGFSLRPDYAYAAQSVYKSEVTPLDFRQKPGQSTQYINSWVKQNTMGKIPTLFNEELNRQTNMILASTLYFHGFWEQTFYDADDNNKQPFYPDGPESLPLGITFMLNGGTFPFYDSDEYNCRILGLPYKGNQTTMYIIEPHDSTRLSLQQLQKNLTGELINELISKMEYRTAIIAFPKFHVRSEMNLKTPLERMGIYDIFINGLADFALINDPKQNTEEAEASSSPTLAEPAVKTTTLASKKSPPPYSELFDHFGFYQQPAAQPTFRPEPIYEMVNVQEGDLLIGTPTLVTRPPKKDIFTKLSTVIPNPENKPSPRKHSISRREASLAPDSTKALHSLDQLRSTAGLKRPNLYVDEIVHKVDFKINEQGTEAAAVTAASLNKSGPDVTMRCDKPFLILVRHDPTKLPLFYGKVNIPLAENK